MKKIIYLFACYVLLFTYYVMPVAAVNDLTVTCSSSGCTKSSDLPLFNEVNIAPGNKFSQNVTVRNDRDGDCELKTTAVDTNPGILSDRLFLQISSGYSDTLSQFYKNNPSLGIINSGTTTVFTWSAEFDRQAGNEYQNLSSIFDLNLNFTCDEPSGGSVASANSNSAPTCDKATPLAVTINQITDNGDGTATLSWSSPDSTYTHYLISFGSNRTNFAYGAPNIGRDNIYTVRGLTSGAQYCFYIKAINDCAPGPASNIQCINEGAAPGTTIPEGFSPGVLGEQTTAAPNIELGSVMGKNDDCSHRWLPLLFIFAFLINLFFFNPLLSFIISLLSFIIDWYLLQSRCCLINPIFCQYFWIGNILSYLLPFVFKMRRK